MEINEIQNGNKHKLDIKTKKHNLCWRLFISCHRSKSNEVVEQTTKELCLHFSSLCDTLCLCQLSSFLSKIPISNNDCSNTLYKCYSTPGSPMRNSSSNFLIGTWRGEYLKIWDGIIFENRPKKEARPLRGKIENAVAEAKDLPGVQHGEVNPVHTISSWFLKLKLEDNIDSKSTCFPKDRHDQIMRG